MSTLRVNNLQIGQSGTAAQNFTLYQPTTPDGTLRLAVGNSGATTGDVLSVSSTGLSVTGTLTSTGVNTFPAGSASAPSITTTGDTNTGVFFPAADTVGVATGGTERMRIDSSGNVMIGLTSQNGKLTIAMPTGNGTLGVQTGSVTADSVRLQAGNSVNTWLEYRGYLGHAWFVDTTERMRITSAGSVLVGTTTELGRLQSNYCPALNDNSSAAANQRGTIVAYLPSSGTNDNGAFNGLLFISGNAAGTNPPQYIRAYSATNAATPVFQVLHSGNVQNANNSYGAISDIRLKENITDATPKLDNLNKLRIVTFNLKNDPDKLKQIGLIAQEVENVFPGLVEADGEGTKSVKYSVFVPMLIKAMQEQQALITALIARVATLEGTQP